MARSTEDDTWTPFTGCPECKEPDPNTRSIHFLQFARGTDLDTLRAHLTEFYVHGKDRGRERPDLVEDICSWISALITQYSHLPDPTTGQPMPWWQARAMMMQARDRLARQAYERAPEKYRERREGRDVTGFTLAGTVGDAPLTSGTPFPDEAPYPVDPEFLDVEDQWSADEEE